MVATKEFQLGFDESSRTVFLQGDIENEVSARVIEQLIFLDKVNKPITLYINSCGGNVYDMYGVYGIIQTLRSDVFTIGVGSVMSAAVLLLASGANRQAINECSFMVHESSLGSDDEKASRLSNRLKHVIDMDNRWYELMEVHTGTVAKRWKKLCSSDYFFDCDLAIELGIIDKVI